VIARTTEPVIFKSWVEVETDGERLDGELVLPRVARGLVVFAQASGRRAPRNHYVAFALQQAGFATLLFDLLTPAEERVDLVTADHRFDVALLAHRLIGAVDWVRGVRALRRLPLGLLGASTGAAAALIAAAARAEAVAAIVTRGGRPDLAGCALARVRAPTLLLVGSRDPHVATLNRRATAALVAPHDLSVVVGATHLFEEPGALQHVATRARDWFATHFARADERLLRSPGGRA